MKKPVHEQPAGLTYDLIYEIRKAMRILRRAEKRLAAFHRAEKKARRNESYQVQRANALAAKGDPS